ncbi:MAG: nucleotide exchange factor GrpE [Anaerolineae bacterium]|nr:nucleotide exchange factor GrpE [Anaerolineae bacterium]
MSERRKVWAALADLLQRADNRNAAAPEKIRDLENEVRKLGKAQFKANTLMEDQIAQWERILALGQAAQEQNEALAAALQQQQQISFNQQMLNALLPTLDSLEQAINSGQNYLQKRDRVAQSPTLTPAQAIIVSPADRAMLAGWLNGLRLVHERLLAVLAAGGVTPIPTIGKPFDPFRHKAVATIPTPEGTPPNTIAQEEQRGYETTDGVLRYAEVVVYR